MTKKRLRVLLLAGATVLVCLVLIVACTYALFSGSVKVDNHLQAGTLKMTLVREKLTSYNLAADGNMTETTDDTSSDFTEATDNNIFGFTDSIRIVPMSSFTADMVIKNEGDIAFVYWVEIVFDPTSNSQAFAEQLTLSVTPEGGETQTKSLKDGLSLGSDTDELGTVDLGGEAKFSVTVTFDNLEDEVNNSARDSEVSFDLIVHAVQATA